VADDRISNDQDAPLDPEDVNSGPLRGSASTVSKSVGGTQGTSDQASSDPNDEVPVPIAMSPAEIDERAQAVEALRATETRGAGDDQNLSA
jgi:hypothetical protein